MVGSRWNRARFQFASSKQGLARLEDHTVVYFKQLIHEEPRAICRAFHTVTIFKNPIPINVLDCALEATKLVVFELDIARWHTADLNLVAASEREHLVELRSIDEFELDPVVCVSALALIARFHLTTCASPA